MTMEDFDYLDEEYSSYFVHGWQKDSVDDRDYKYSVHAPDDVPDPLPSKSSILDKMPPVLNQGQIGSCTAHGIGSAIAYLRWKDGDSRNDWFPSRLFIYYYERFVEGTVDQDPGAMIRDGIKVVAEYGAPEENLWPYDTSKFKIQPPQEALNEAAQHKVYNYYRVNWESLEEVKSCLAAGYPIIFGFDVYSEFQSRQVGRTGLLPMPGPKSKKDGGHCVLAIGYDDDIQCPGAQKGAVLIRNSWGSDWGLHGNFWMPYEYITSPSLSDDFWTIRATY